MFKERFIIHSTMSQDEILRKLEENIQADYSLYSLFSSQKIKDFKGKIDGYNFEMTRIPGFGKKGYLMSIVIKGEIFENSVFTEMDFSNYQKYRIYSAFVIILIISVLILFSNISSGKSDIDFLGNMIIPFFLCLTFPFIIKMVIYHQEKIYLKKLFNGTIEKVA